MIALMPSQPEPRLETRTHLKSEKEWAYLREANSYRDFLLRYLEQKKITMSQFAFAAGYTRGFPGEVLSGKRRLTTKSCLSFEKAMKIPPQGRRLFRYLVAIAEPDTFPDIDRLNLDSKIHEVRQKAWGRFVKITPNSHSDFAELFRNPALMHTFAACGQIGEKINIESVRLRAQLTETELSKNLEKLIRIGVVSENNGFYSPVDQHLFLHSPGGMLAKVFIEATNRAQKRVSIAAKSESEMFFVSTFSIQKNRLPELKKRWREVVLQFVDEAMINEGDTVVQLQTSLHK